MGFSGDKLGIAYAGTLQGYSTDSRNPIKRLFGAFENRSVNDPKTRTGHFLFQGIKKFTELYPEKRSFLEVKLWGIIDKQNQREVEELGLTDIISISGYLPKAESLVLLEKADVMFLPLEASVNGNPPFALPGKMYDYLRIGKPVLALAEPSDCTRILQAAGIGIICDPFNPGEIAKCLLELVETRFDLRNIYEPNKSYIENNYSYKALTTRLVNIFDKL